MTTLAINAHLLATIAPPPALPLRPMCAAEAAVRLRYVTTCARLAAARARGLDAFARIKDARADVAAFDAAGMAFNATADFARAQGYADLALEVIADLCADAADAAGIPHADRLGPLTPTGEGLDDAAYAAAVIGGELRRYAAWRESL